MEGKEKKEKRPIHLFCNFFFFYYNRVTVFIPAFIMAEWIKSTHTHFLVCHDVEASKVIQYV